METTDRSTTDLNMQEEDGPLLSYYLPSNDMQTLGRVGTSYLVSTLTTQNVLVNSTARHIVVFMHSSETHKRANQQQNNSSFTFLLRISFACAFA